MTIATLLAERQTFAEDWHPVVKGRRGVVHVLKRAEAITEATLRRRFARQAQGTLPALVALLPGLIERVGTSPQAFAQPQRVPREVSDTIDLVFDTSIDEGEMLRVQHAQERAARAGFQSSMTRLGVGAAERARYNMVARSSVSWLQSHINPLFRSIDDTSKVRLSRSLARGLERGEHLDALTRRVERTIGEGGWRARMIAQTETINAHSQAAEITAEQLGVEELQWLDAQPGACPVCRDLHEQTKASQGDVAYRSSSGQYVRARPPAHPACRCVQIPHLPEAGRIRTPEEVAAAGPVGESVDNFVPYNIDEGRPDVGDIVEIGRGARWRIDAVTPKGYRGQQLETGRKATIRDAQIKRISRGAKDRPTPLPRKPDTPPTVEPLERELPKARDFAREGQVRRRRLEEEYFEERKPWDAYVRGPDVAVRPSGPIPRTPQVRLREEMLEEFIFVDPKDAARFKTKLGPALQNDEIAGGIHAFARIIGRGTKLDDRTIKFKTSRARSPRGFYSLNDEAITIGRNTQSNTVVHEMGHWFEHKATLAPGAAERDIAIRQIVADNEALRITRAEAGDRLRAVFEQFPSQNNPVAAARRSFYDRRTAGESPQQLRRLTGQRYDTKEVARPDEFSNPYSGKEYGGTPGAVTDEVSEVISMGLQSLWEDPVRFAEQDPDYFDFIMEVLRIASGS